MTQKAKPVTSEFQARGKVGETIHMLLPALIVGAALLVVIVVVVIVIDIHRKNESKLGVCSTSLISQAASNFSPNKLSGLSSVAPKVEALKNYQKDPNCMYIMTVYYNNQMNAPKLESSLKQFNIAYKGTLSSTLLQYESVAQLRNTVKLTQDRLQAITKNMLNFSPPPYKAPPGGQ